MLENNNIVVYFFNFELFNKNISIFKYKNSKPVFTLDKIKYLFLYSNFTNCSRYLNLNF